MNKINEFEHELENLTNLVAQGKIMKSKGQFDYLVNKHHELLERSKKLENVIGGIANIDTVFIEGDQEIEFTDKEALDKIMEIVDPIWVQACERRLKDLKEEVK